MKGKAGRRRDEGKNLERGMRKKKVEGWIRKQKWMDG